MSLIRLSGISTTLGLVRDFSTPLGQIFGVTGFSGSTPLSSPMAEPMPAPSPSPAPPGIRPLRDFQKDLDRLSDFRKLPTPTPRRVFTTARPPPGKQRKIKRIFKRTNSREQSTRRVIQERRKAKNVLKKTLKATQVAGMAGVVGAKVALSKRKKKRNKKKS
jgi:hypothetical protein